MLVLSRKRREQIVLPSYGIRITVLQTRSGRVRLGFEAPPEIKILRAELTDDGRSEPASAPPPSTGVSSTDAIGSSEPNGASA